MSVDWDNFPPIDKEEERLAAYQLQRVIDEAATTIEKKRVAEIIFKKDLGHALTQAEMNILAYSPFGTAASCGY
jgi:hypothetical protein